MVGSMLGGGRVHRPDGAPACRSPAKAPHRLRVTGGGPGIGAMVMFQVVVIYFNDDRPRPRDGIPLPLDGYGPFGRCWSKLFNRPSGPLRLGLLRRSAPARGAVNGPTLPKQLRQTSGPGRFPKAASDEDGVRRASGGQPGTLQEAFFCCRQPLKGVWLAVRPASAARSPPAAENCRVFWAGRQAVGHPAGAPCGLLPGRWRQIR